MKNNNLSMRISTCTAQSDSMQENPMLLALDKGYGGGEREREGREREPAREREKGRV